MNVFLYEALDRYSPGLSIMSNNTPEIDRIYSLEAKSGFLLIAYPNKDVDTNFEFKYWIGTNDELPKPEPELEFDAELFVIVAAVVVSVILIIVCLLILYDRTRSNKKVSTGDD